MSDRSQSPRPIAKPPTGVLERALLVLDCFAHDQPRLHLREIAARTGLDKATILRILGTYGATRYVQRLDDGRYAPGPAVLRLAAIYNAVSDLGVRMTAVLQRVVAQMDESAAFYTREGGDRVCVARVNADRAVRYQVEIGHGVPLSHGGAAAHILLAHSGGHSARTQDALQQGYMTTAGERDSDLASIAIPVFEADDAFLGALVVSSPISRQSDTAWQRAREIVATELRAQGFASTPQSGRTAPSQPKPQVRRKAAALRTRT